MCYNTQAAQREARPPMPRFASERSRVRIPSSPPKQETLDKPGFSRTIKGFSYPRCKKICGFLTRIWHFEGFFEPKMPSKNGKLILRQQNGQEAHISSIPSILFFHCLKTLPSTLIVHPAERICFHVSRSYRMEIGPLI